MALIQGKQIAASTITPNNMDATGDYTFHDLLLNGNLVVQGTTTTLDSTTVTTGDNQIVLNNNITDNAHNSNGGIAVKRLDTDNTTRIDAELNWNETTGLWEAGTIGSLSNIVTDLRLGSTATATTSGAYLTGIFDAGNYYTSTNVEGALQEIGNQLSSIATSTSVTNLEQAVGSSTGLAGLDYSSNNYVIDNTSLKDAVSALDNAIAAEASARSTGDSNTLSSANSYTDSAISSEVTRADGAYVNITGDTMTGLLILDAGATIPTGQVITITDAPTNGTDGANKTYVDTSVSTEAAARAAADTAIRNDLASNTTGLGASLVGIEDAGNYFTGTTVEAALQELGTSQAADNTAISDLQAAVGSSTGTAGLNYSSNNVVVDSSSLKDAISAIDAFFGSLVTTADFDKLHGITATATQINTAVADAHTRAFQVLTVSADGQTAFTLSNAATSDSIVEMFVNGQSQINGVDFAVSGTSLTWNNVDFTLATTDKVTVSYDVAA